MNTEAIRSQFPAIIGSRESHTTVFLDGPAGTQVPQSVIDAISDYYQTSNANSHGHFGHSARTDQLLMQTREKIATFLGASSPYCVSFGQNMTSLNFSLSKALMRTFEPGDEIFITQLDHESNRGPWLVLEERGIVCREIKLKEDGTLDLDQFAHDISDKTRLVCVGYASNILGTVNDIARIRSLCNSVGARLLVDAVHYAPHLSIDVKELDCDFLLCSAYKFYGPHVGILYSRPGLLDELKCDNLRTQEQVAPYKIETGTLNHAAIAGVEAAIDFLASLSSGSDLRSKLIDCMNQLHVHEMHLIRMLSKGLSDIHGLQIYGPSTDLDQRAPTISFTMDQFSAAELCQKLGSKGINAWDGHFYAIRTTEVLQLLERGGVTRMGISIYNNESDIERTVKVMKEIAN